MHQYGVRALPAAKISPSAPMPLRIYIYASRATIQSPALTIVPKTSPSAPPRTFDSEPEVVVWEGAPEVCDALAFVLDGSGGKVAGIVIDAGSLSESTLLQIQPNTMNPVSIFLSLGCTSVRPHKLTYTRYSRG